MATMEMIRKIHELFASKGLTLAVAESCTGGYVSHLLTQEPGASQVLEAGIVAYSNASKRKFLSLRSTLIKKHGVISEEAARAMARGIERATGADVGLAITGNLGPTVLEERPVGEVFIAVSSGQEATSRGYHFEGSRVEIKEQSVDMALHFLYEAVTAWTSGAS